MGSWVLYILDAFISSPNSRLLHTYCIGGQPVFVSRCMHTQRTSLWRFLFPGNNTDLTVSRNLCRWKSREQQENKQTSLKALSEHRWMDHSLTAFLCLWTQLVGVYQIRADRNDNEALHILLYGKAWPPMSTKQFVLIYEVKIQYRWQICFTFKYKCSYILLNKNRNNSNRNNKKYKYLVVLHNKQLLNVRYLVLLTVSAIIGKNCDCLYWSGFLVKAD